ncbi:GNAT family N-acetyltransferase [Halalkalicoccus jeotgali]|uniref:GCN5-like N-acetyltransferase n=1 Tax=Halalkalicoccus jeotgali (strain DSM 18796 / CECT 7217 / JCM 14584 / KCTC 4019 / B3) TaxID=795797 RepID=D8J5Z4_HALJB|nr:GNAT family N-acetyltransferase [Halalkalicoccus jeotgali]ADJ13800.1 GCN5-related N-acetyltransferase [Halalkalicoccus jeotgali B3]ELY34154.1 GCN5-like N-acetyltransferase [Halalkalicoccus jeotgali B3]
MNAPSYIRPPGSNGLVGIQSAERWDEGIGSQLLAAAKTELECDRLALSVLAGNEVGVEFYERWGFDRVEERTVELSGVEHREYRYEKAI